MTRKEFEGFYKYITALTVGDQDLTTKEKFRKALKNTPLDTAMTNAMNVYKYLEHSPSMVNPRVFKGELPNPGLYKNFNNCDLPC